MPITSLHIKDFRNFAAVEIEPLSGLNIVYGMNGSGKTSLLEAIHYLGRGRSFRSSSTTPLIRHTTDKFSIFAKLCSDLMLDLSIGLTRDNRGEMRLRISDREVTSMVELASFFPIRLINSQSHNLFESGPVFRRKYLDWGLFYQTEGFFPCWRHYDRALKQRNVILREQRPRQELDCWTEELIKYGTELNQYRYDYINALNPLLTELAQTLLPIGEIEVTYDAGWDDTKDFRTVLGQQYLEELRYGRTQSGPHRADFDIKIQGVSSRHFLSRGQQKLLICAMILAQGMLLVRNKNKGLTYLVDDLPAELDLQSRRRLIALFPMQATQVFITAIESEMICDLLETNMPKQLFHVEQGRISVTQ